MLNMLVRCVSVYFQVCGDLEKGNNQTKWWLIRKQSIDGGLRYYQKDIHSRIDFVLNQKPFQHCVMQRCPIIEGLTSLWSDKCKLIY